MMNENAMPNSASASIRPMPMNIVVRTWLAYSGCRAIASTDLPIRMPSPIPGPMASSPMIRPLPIVSRPEKSAAACASNPNMHRLLVSVFFRQHATDVGGGEDREDERLQDGHEHLEPDQDDRQRHRDPEQDPRLRPVQQEELGAEERERQQEVSGHEVGRETDRQRDRSDHDVRDEFDEHQQRVAQERRRARDDARESEVSEEPMLGDPDHVVREPRDGREDAREYHSGA